MSQNIWWKRSIKKYNLDIKEITCNVWSKGCEKQLHWELLEDLSSFQWRSFFDGVSINLIPPIKTNKHCVSKICSSHLNIYENIALD